MVADARPNELLVGLRSDPKQYLLHSRRHFLARVGCRCSLKTSAVISILTEGLGVAADNLDSLDKFDCFLHVFYLLLGGDKPDKEEREEGASGLGNVQDPKIVEIALFHAYETVEEVAKHFA